MMKIQSLFSRAFLLSTYIFLKIYFYLYIIIARLFIQEIFNIKYLQIYLTRIFIRKFFLKLISLQNTQ